MILISDEYIHKYGTPNNEKELVYDAVQKDGTLMDKVFDKISHGEYVFNLHSTEILMRYRNNELSEIYPFADKRSIKFHKDQVYPFYCPIIDESFICVKYGSRAEDGAIYLIKEDLWTYANIVESYDPERWERNEPFAVFTDKNNKPSFANSDSVFGGIYSEDKHNRDGIIVYYTEDREKIAFRHTIRNKGQAFCILMETSVFESCLSKRMTDIDINGLCVDTYDKYEDTVGVYIVGEEHETLFVIDFSDKNNEGIVMRFANGKELKESNIDLSVLTIDKEHDW